ncbi:MAG: DUF58 domain-containing protein [Chitinispirillaceae bacterium]
MSSFTFLKPEQLVPIRSLSLRAKLIVEGIIAGLHRSPYHGFSADFLEYRPYRFGEPTRMIDWRKFARSDKTVVRLFEDETNLYARILVDTSASMRFKGGGQMTKYDYARTVAASLAWILIRQRDAVGVVTFDEKIGLSVPPRSTNVQLKTILNTLEAVKPSNATACGKALNTIAQTLRKRGLSVIISDMLDDPDDIIQGLRHLRFKRQEVVVIWVSDPQESDFRQNTPLRMIDIETNQELVLDAQTAAQYHMDGFTSHRRKIEEACKELAIDCEIVTTDTPFHTALFRILEKRRRLN